MRNEDDVLFQLVYCPNLRQIEKDCFAQNLRHMKRFKDLYVESGRIDPERIPQIDHSLRFCPFSCAEGLNLSDIRTQRLQQIKKKQSGPNVRRIESVVTVTVDEEENGAQEDTPSTASSSADIIRHHHLSIDEQEEDEKMHDIDVLNGQHIVANLPSSGDTKHILSSSLGDDHRLLHEFEAFYTVKIVSLVNVTQLPLFQHHVKDAHKNLKGKPKWSILVRHELWYECDSLILAQGFLHWILSHF